MLDINELKFDEKGLIPAVVVDAESKNVLTVAYMNKESLLVTLKTRALEKGRNIRKLSAYRKYYG